MRWVTNCHITACFNQLMRSIWADPNSIHFIIDYGAKYTKNAKLLIEALGTRNNWRYIPMRNDI